jgi:hypothetical protein
MTDVADIASTDAPSTDASTDAANAASTEAKADHTEEATEVDADFATTIDKAMKRNWNAPKHVAFANWINRESNEKYTMDMATIVACQALYQVFRKTDEFIKLSEELEAAGPRPKEEPLPTTPEEAAAQLAKDEKRMKQLEAQAKRYAERAARVRELQAKMAAGQAGEAATAETPAEPAPQEEPAF